MAPRNCVFKGCKNTADYNVIGSEPKYCDIHKTDDMINVKDQCSIAGCLDIATHRTKIGNVKYCSIHKPKGCAKISKGSKCVMCGKRASYGLKGTTKPTHCSKCAEKVRNEAQKQGKLLLLVNVGFYPCDVDDCIKAGMVYKEIKGTITYRCLSHRVDGDGYVGKDNTLCITKDCYITASYGDKKGGAKLYCKEHGGAKSINVSSKDCPGGIDGSSCGLRAEFADPKDISIRYCRKHAVERSIILDNIVETRYCHFEPDDKEIEPIKIKNERKIYCKKRPSFNLAGNKEGLYCYEHKKADMINVTAKKCVYCKETIATFGNKGSREAICCRQHREQFREEFGTYPVDVRHKVCKEEGCIYRRYKDFEDYCYECYKQKFPADIKFDKIKAKENSVVDFITDTYTSFKWNVDKVVGCGGGSLKRPDLFTKFDSYSLVIEVDEYQHRGYDKICEENRIKELATDFKDKSMIVIRFNPDSYKKANGKEEKTCWTYDAKNKELKHKKSWNDRLLLLKNTIDNILVNYKTIINNEKFVIIRLYYDEIDELEETESNVSCNDD